MPPRGDARIREREAQRAAEAAEKASEGEEDLDFEELGIEGLGCKWDHGIVIVVRVSEFVGWVRAQVVGF